jgi:hypothetical protein
MGYVACVRQMRHEFRISVEYIKERDHLGDLGIDERVTLNWFLK